MLVLGRLQVLFSVKRSSILAYLPDICLASWNSPGGEKTFWYRILAQEA